MNFLKARPLERGDNVGAFSPSDWLGGNRRERVMESARVLEGTGLGVTIAPHAWAQDGIRAGTVAQRTSDMEFLLKKNDVCAMIATYGGKACNQLIESLPYKRFKSRRIPLLGFSDVAVLQNAVTATTGLATFYGPNILAKIGDSQWGKLDSLRLGDPLFHTDRVFGATAPNGAACVRSGSATGRLFGGNLECFIYGNLLSRTDLSFFKGGIFFWESGGITPREADQALTALGNTGFLGTISGMIIGDAFSTEGYEWFRSDPLKSVLHATREFKFPILYWPNFGHKALENPIIPIGATATLDAGRMTVRAAEPYLEDRGRQ